MEPSLCLTSSCTATRQRSTSIATCGTACWTGNKERPPWRWLPGARCRAGTLTVRRRRSTGSQLWSCQRCGQGTHLAVFNGTTNVSRRGLASVLYRRDWAPEDSGFSLYITEISGATLRHFVLSGVELMIFFPQIPLSLQAQYSVNNSLQFAVVFT